MKYNVILTRDITESVIVTVKAKSKSDAEKEALDMAGKYGGGIVDTWRVDEGNFSEIYVTNVEPDQEWDMQEILIEVGGDHGDGNVEVVSKPMGVAVRIIDYDCEYIDKESGDVCPVERLYDEDVEI